MSEGMLREWYTCRRCGLHGVPDWINNTNKTYHMICKGCDLVAWGRGARPKGLCIYYGAPTPPPGDLKDTLIWDWNVTDEEINSKYYPIN